MYQNSNPLRPVRPFGSSNPSVEQLKRRQSEQLRCKKMLYRKNCFWSYDLFVVDVAFHSLEFIQLILLVINLLIFICIVGD